MNVTEYTQRIYPNNSTVSKAGTKGTISQHVKRYLGKDPPYKLSSLNQTSATIELSKSDFTFRDGFKRYYQLTNPDNSKS